MELEILAQATANEPGFATTSASLLGCGLGFREGPYFEAFNSIPRNAAMHLKQLIRITSRNIGSERMASPNSSYRNSTCHVPQHCLNTHAIRVEGGVWG